MQHDKGYLCLVLIAVAASASLLPLNFQQLRAQDNQTSEEENKNFVLNLPKSGLNTEQEIDQYLVDNATIHNEKVADQEHLKNISKAFETAFPDMKAEQEVIVADGDMVGVLWTLNGTHSGEYLGVPPTGKHVSFKMAEFMKITNGTISEYWNVPDATDLLIDIGYLVKNNATNTTTTAAGAQ
jgi:predicted ester cyclase